MSEFLGLFRAKRPGLILKKIPQIMKAVGAIGKDRTNDVQRYKFRGIEDIYNTFHPVLSEMGVFCVPEVLERQCTEIESVNAQGQRKMSYRTILKVRHRFYAEDGSYVDATTIGEGLDTSDKASNKAMSAAMKYAFIELFSIPTQDLDDSDQTTLEPIRQLEQSSARPTFGVSAPHAPQQQVKSVTRAGSFVPSKPKPTNKFDFRT